MSPFKVEFELVRGNGRPLISKAGEIEIALVYGDGVGPETMKVSCPIIEYAAQKYNGIKIVWRLAPMGWSAFDDKNLRDTFPESSVKTVLECGIVYFGAVGIKERDDTDGVKFPGMKPETKALLGLRKLLDLLINWRPIVIPDQDINQLWGRFTLEDVYFGTIDLLPRILGVTGVPDVSDEDAQKAARFIVEMLGIKLKKDVKSTDPIITELGYYTRRNIIRYAHYMLTYAREHKLPVTNLHKSNIQSTSVLWQGVITEVRNEYYPDVPLRDLYIDAAMTRLVARNFPNGIVLVGNKDGDVGTDGAGGYESLGTMSSGTINPDDRCKALFESGAGTACDIAGKGIANPSGRIKSGAELLRHIGATEGGKAVDRAVTESLKAGICTRDLVDKLPKVTKVVDTKGMAEAIMSRL